VIHLLADIALLTFAFHHTGGVENPFLVFYMLPLTLAAYALSWPRLLGEVIAACLMLVLLNQQQTPALQFDYAVHETSELIAVALITYFAYVVSRLSRGHDRRVARAREEALNVMGSQALGSVAARAADTISSPLSTMSVLVNELRQERLSETERDAALQTLTLQIAQCKTRLSELLDSVGHSRAGNGEPRDIRALVQTAVHECELIDPDLQVDVDQPTTSAPRVVEERSLVDALVMLIRHCGRGAPHQVHIDIRWSRHWVTLELQGRESAPCTAAAGECSDGSIVLAATMIERFKGSLSCRADGRQCLLRIRLPAMPAPLHERPAPALSDT
jgi:two-component system sensor histidine kinase RegB